MGIYFVFQKKPPGPTKLKKDGTPRTVAELSAIHGFEKPKVRTVSEILEQTRVIPESAREVSRDADKARVDYVFFQIISSLTDFESLKRISFLNLLFRIKTKITKFKSQEKDVYDWRANEDNDLDGPINSLKRSVSIESGLTNVQSLIDEIDKEHRKYCKDLVEGLSEDDILSR